jgi:cysteine desulfurase
VPLIVGLGKAASLAARFDEPHRDQQARLRNRLQDGLVAELPKECVVHSGDVERLPNTLSISFPGVNGQQLLSEIPELCASTGAACHSGATGISATLGAMGVSGSVARGTIRLSLGWTTTEDDVELAANLLIEAWQRLAQVRGK